MNSAGMSLQELPDLRLSPRSSSSALMAVDFGDSSQAAPFDLQLSLTPSPQPADSGSEEHAEIRVVPCSLRAPIGEQLKQFNCSEADFTREQSMF